MSDQLTLAVLQEALSGHSAAFRCVTEYQPAGGPGDKVFPPTYAGGKYAVETRVVGEKLVPCVVLNSVQAEANRMELALLEAWQAKRIALPVVRVTFDFSVKGIKKSITVTSLEASHRLADAVFRDSLLRGENVIFRKSTKGAILDRANIRNATELFGLCPTALLFGLWDSAGPRGGLGAKFQRAIVSEIVGWGAQPGVTTGGKVDHLTILKSAGPLYDRASKTNVLPDWTLDTQAASKKDNEPRRVGEKGQGNPSDVNLGGVTPDLAYVRDERGKILTEDGGAPRIKGGFTIEKAVQTTVLSLVAIRRLRFPLKGKDQKEQAAIDVAARTALAALGLCAAALAREQGADLRSRCQLVPSGPFVWELLNTPGKEPRYELSSVAAVQILSDAMSAAKAQGLPWEKDPVDLTPSPDLLQLVQRSHEIAAEAGEVEEEE